MLAWPSWMSIELSSPGTGFGVPGGGALAPVAAAADMARALLLVLRER